MTKEKFTPNEWQAVPTTTNGSNGFNIQWSNDGELVADFVYEQADAHLIAAAPKLYNMLKLAYHEFKQVASWCEDNNMEYDAQGYLNLAEGIYTVLKKARGEE